MAITIAFVLFPGVTQLDFTGPAQVLSRLPDAEVLYAAATTAPVLTDCGFSVLPTVKLSAAGRADLVCVPGGFGIVEAMGEEGLLADLRRLAAGAAYVTSVCTGAFVLGAAGLLRGKRATTHWAYHDLLPLAGAVPERARVVRDGKLVTGGGVTAGIDFALTLAAEIAGEATARAIATAIEYDPAPPFGSGTPHAQPPAIGEALYGRYREPVARTKDALARALGTS